MQKRKWGLILLTFVVLAANCKKEEEKDLQDYVEEARLLNLADDLIHGRPNCAPNQALVRFSNTVSMGPQSLALFDANSCATRLVVISNTIPEGSLSGYVCVNSLGTGYYAGPVDGTSCSVSAYFMTAGHAYTISSISGGYWMDIDD